jgi:GTPase SAR1 family protein
MQSVKEYWLEEATNSNRNNAAIFLIGNKLDDAQQRREVESFSIENVMGGNVVAKHFEVSAKTGENIEKCFMEISRMLMARRKVGAEDQQSSPSTKTKETVLNGSHTATRKSTGCCVN